MACWHFLLQFLNYYILYSIHLSLASLAWQAEEERGEKEGGKGSKAAPAREEENKEVVLLPAEAPRETFVDCLFDLDLSIKR